MRWSLRILSLALVVIVRMQWSASTEPRVVSEAPRSCGFLTSVEDWDAADEADLPDDDRCGSADEESPETP